MAKKAFGYVVIVDDGETPFFPEDAVDVYGSITAAKDAAGDVQVGATDKTPWLICELTPIERGVPGEINWTKIEEES